MSHTKNNIPNIKSKKLPAIQFYPGDWWRDLGVMTLNCEERGAWFQILLLMHDSEIRGYLLVNGISPSSKTLANMLSLEVANVKQILSNLISKGVASYDKKLKTIYCRRMVRDNKLRKIRALAGSKGGKISASKRQAKSSISFSSSVSSSLKDNIGNNHKFEKPKIEDIKEYLLEIRKDIKEAVKFFDYHESKGWIIGRTPMKDWKAACRTWIRNAEEWAKPEVKKAIQVIETPTRNNSNSFKVPLESERHAAPPSSEFKELIKSLSENKGI